VDEKPKQMTRLQYQISKTWEEGIQFEKDPDFYATELTSFMDGLLTASKGVPMIAVLLCCKLDKTITLTKILERFPVLLPTGAFMSQVEANYLAQIDIGFLDSPFYRDEVLPSLTTRSITPIQLAIELGRKQLLSVLLEEAETTFDLLMVN
jgi:hypothetical protein